VSSLAPSPGPAGAPFRSFVFDGWEILVGKGAQANDELTFRVARPGDLWLHASGFAGSHVIIRTADREDPPREVVERAAQLAAYYSKAREAGGKVTVHVCRASDVRKPPGAPAGQVELRRFEVVRVYVNREGEGEGEGNWDGARGSGTP
jgi:predicted ribosome quality control (RQC) complex YloA/Tae2 family protein